MIFVVYIGHYATNYFPPPVAFALIVAGTYAGVFVAYELLVKRISFLRFAFGLRAKPKIVAPRSDRLATE
jgi:hypothetical protein